MTVYAVFVVYVVYAVYVVCVVCVVHLYADVVYAVHAVDVVDEPEQQRTVQQDTRFIIENIFFHLYFTSEIKIIAVDTNFIVLNLLLTTDNC